MAEDISRPEDKIVGLVKETIPTEALKLVNHLQLWTLSE